MIFLEINTKNQTHLINTDDISNIEFDKHQKWLTIRLHNKEEIKFTGRDIDVQFAGRDIDVQYNKLISLMKKTFMIIPIEMNENITKEHVSEDLPNVAKRLPELDHCTLITEKEDK